MIQVKVDTEKPQALRANAIQKGVLGKRESTKGENRR